MKSSFEKTKVLAARETLRERFAALEDRVTGSVDHVREAVTGTVDETTSKVHGLLQTTTDGLGEVLDFRQRIREHPWEGTAFAVAAGVVAGLMSRGATSRVAVSMAGPQARTEENSILGKLWGVARRELLALGESAIVSATQSLKTQVEEIVEPGTSAAPRMHSMASANGYTPKHVSSM